MFGWKRALTDRLAQMDFSLSILTHEMAALRYEVYKLSPEAKKDAKKGLRPVAPVVFEGCVARDFAKAKRAEDE